MHARLYQVCTRLKYQIPMLIVLGTCLAALLCRANWSGADVTALDRSAYIAFLGAIASVLALFCSISMSWVLFVSQQNRVERIATYDLLKAKISEVQEWLLSQPGSEDRELCLSLVYELDKLEMSDLPQKERGEEYRAYANALDEALEEEGGPRRRFYQVSVRHFGYIEGLLNRIGMISIRQIITRVFIDTLAKGFSLVGLAVLVLIAASGWYMDQTKVAFVIVGGLLGLASIQLLLEFFVDVNRIYDEELNFIDRGEENNDVDQRGD